MLRAICLSFDTILTNLSLKKDKIIKFLNCLNYSGTPLACFHDQNKSGFFWRAGFFPTNQSYLNSF